MPNAALELKEPSSTSGDASKVLGAVSMMPAAAGSGGSGPDCTCRAAERCRPRALRWRGRGDFRGMPFYFVIDVPEYSYIVTVTN